MLTTCFAIQHPLKYILIREILKGDYFFAKKELKRVLSDKYPDSSSFELQY